MAQIDPDMMGDVHPAVEPGRAGDYGHARLEHDGPCEIRSFQTATVIYTAGKFGLDDTGAIRVAFRFVQDGGRLQTNDPSGANYVTASTTGGAALQVLVEPHAERPWLIAIRVTVRGGFIRPGETITVVVGDRTGGSPGWRMQTISESTFDFRVSVDACATGQFTPLSPPLTMPVVPGPAESLHLIAPGLRVPGDLFDLGLRAEDAWGNPCAVPETVYLEADGPIEGLPEQVAPTGSGLGQRVSGLSLSAPGTVRITARTASGKLSARSNPIVCADGALRGYWGDLHGQSGETVGIGSLDEYMTFARDAAFLDVTSHQANDFQLTNAFWDRINTLSAELDQPGKFVCYPGYEWSGNTPVGGDHNVFFRHEGRQIRRSSHAMLHDRSDLDTDATTLPELFEDLQDEDCVLWAHVGGRPADVGRAHDARLRTAVEVHSNWGTFEWILTDSLALGHRVGVVANSDGHKGRPGAGGPGATEFGAYGGLTCYLTPSLDRDAIFECMRRRHHYGTTGSRLHLDVRTEFDTPATLFERDPAWSDAPGQPVTEDMMGDIVLTGADRVRLHVSVTAAAPIERVDILRGAEEVETLRTYGADALGARLRVYWQGAEYRGRGRNTHWQGSVTVRGSEIATMTPVNHWNHERLLKLETPDRLVFDAVTSGNYAGADLVLSDPGAEIVVETNLVSGRLRLAEIGLEDVVFDAGGLGRQITLRRLPDAPEAREISREVQISLVPGQDNPLWVRVTMLDGHQAWSSPIYVLTRN